MTLPTSGPLSLTDIQTEFGGSNPIGLNEYYAGGAYVSAGTTGTYGPVPSSGAISIQNFYGTSSVKYWITKISFSPAATSSGGQTSLSFASNGDIVVTARNTGAGAVPVLRMTDAGVVSWCKSLFLDGSGYNYPKFENVLVLSDGSILQYGLAYDYNYSFRGAGIAKYDSSGNLTIQREVYLNETSFWVTSVVQFSNGNLLYGAKGSAWFYIVDPNGYTGIVGHQEYRIISGGSSTTFAATTESTGWMLTDGTYAYMLGQVSNYNSGSGSYDYYAAILITDNSLNFAGSYYYSVSGYTGTYPIYPISLAKASGGYYFTFCTGADNYTFYLTYTTSGGVQWTKSIASGYTRSGNNGPLVTVDSSNNVYVMFYDTIQTTATIFKFDTTGAIVWKRDLTGLDNNYTLSDLKVVNGVLYAFVGGILAKLALSGAGTGTYGSYTYAASSKTYSTGPTVTQYSGIGSNYVTSYVLRNTNVNWLPNTVTPTVTQYPI